MTSPGDPYLTLAALSAYAGVSKRQLRAYLVSPPLPRDAGASVPPPLPHFRLGRRIVVRRSEFDRWMAAYREHVSCALVGVGAAFDFVAGMKRQAPAWIQRAGLEWLFRLACEPRRLWRRYAWHNPRFAVHMALQIARDGRTAR